MVFAYKYIMKYLLTFCPFVGLIAWHGAWRSFECPLLLSVAVLVCIMIKVRSDGRDSDVRGL